MNDTDRLTDKYFDQGLRKWIAKRARKELWKVAPWMDVEDMIAEGYLCYCKCVRVYRPLPDPVEDRKCFMRYFMRAFETHVIVLAAQCTKKRWRSEVTESDESQAPSWVDDRTLDPEQPVLAALQSLPKELADAVLVLANDASLLRTSLRAAGEWVWPGSKPKGMLTMSDFPHWETVRERISRVVGCDALKAARIETELRQLLSP